MLSPVIGASVAPQPSGPIGCTGSCDRRLLDRWTDLNVANSTASTERYGFQIATDKCHYRGEFVDR